MRTYRHASAVLATLVVGMALSACTVESSTPETSTDPFGTQGQSAPADNGLIDVPNPSTERAETPQTDPDPPAEPSEPAAPVEPTEPPKPAGPTPDISGDGTWIVGDDVQPGIYVAPQVDGSFGGCYWERLKDLSGDFDALIANDNASGQAVVEITAKDKAFSTNDCGAWYALSKNNRKPGTKIPADGTFVVGTDIKPGTYRASDASDCYWERLSNFRGDFDAILANDNTNGQTIVEIRASDKGFSSSDCGAWEKVG